jgi:hypothetical protein
MKVELKAIAVINFFHSRGSPCLQIKVSDDPKDMAEIVSGGIGRHVVSFNQDGVKFEGECYIFRIERTWHNNFVEMATDPEAWQDSYRLKKGAKA